MDKEKVLAKIAAALRSNLKLLDKCSQEFDQVIETSITYFTEYRSKWHQQMQADREMLSTSIEATVLEIANSLCQEGAPASTFSQLMWTLVPNELQFVHYKVSPPDLQALFQTCFSYSKDIQVLNTRFYRPSQEVEEVKVNMDQKLAELGEKYELSAETVNQWMEITHKLRLAELLEPLFDKIANNTQIASRVAVDLVQAALELCTRKPEEILDISRGLEELLDKQETEPFLANLSLLSSDLALVATLLDIARLHSKGPILTACMELAALFVIFQRDQVCIPNFATSLVQKPAELTKVVQACSRLILNPTNCLTGLSARLIKALEGSGDAKLLVFVSTLAADLLKAVPPERVEELSLVLLSAAMDAKELHIVEYLRINIAQLTDKLIESLNKPEKLRIEVVQGIFPKPCGVLAQVTSTFLRFFSTTAWGPQVPLRTPIQADSGSTWVVLEDGRLFCSGGGYGQVQTDHKEAWKDAYLLGVDGSVDVMPQMKTARYFHGIIQMLDLYVFGGGKH